MALRMMWAAALLAGLALAPANAAAVEAQAIVEEGLADLAPPRLAPGGWTATGRDAVLGGLCAPREGAVLRVALTTRPPSRWQRDACIANAAAALADRVVGRRVLLAFGGKSAPALTAVLLYRALAARVPDETGEIGPNRAGRWHDLDPSLPDAPIRVLVPPDGTPEARILAQVLLFQGCLAAAGERLPRLAPARLALCTELRGDGVESGAVVVRAMPGQAAAAWLHGAGSAAVALVGLATVAAEPELETPLPLDGVAPGFASIGDGSYRPTLPVHLLLLQAEVPDEAEAVFRVLTGESVIGPSGSLVRRGLAALPAAERVRLRAE